METDMFMNGQELLNIDPVRLHELTDASRLVRRASAVAKSGLFERNFEPLAWKVRQSTQADLLSASRGRYAEQREARDVAP
jgi:hypothetical protein